MRGSNPIRQQQLDPSGRLWVQEVFYTLQGEGPFSGHPALFIRLSGCNLACHWCDTEFESSQWKPDLSELLAEVDRLRPPICNLAVISGGEPFRQNIRPLTEQLLARGLNVQIETNGTLWLDLPNDPRVTIVCSPKTSAINSQMFHRADYFKYVLADGETDAQDGLPTMSTQQTGQRQAVARPPQGAKVFVMPLDASDPAQNERNKQACVRSACEHGYILTLQTHKLLQIR